MNVLGYFFFKYHICWMYLLLLLYSLYARKKCFPFCSQVGPTNPFKTQQQAAKKNMLAGYVEPAHFNAFQFENQRRTFTSYGKHCACLIKNIYHFNPVNWQKESIFILQIFWDCWVLLIFKRESKSLLHSSFPYILTSQSRNVCKPEGLTSISNHPLLYIQSFKMRSEFQRFHQATSSDTNLWWQNSFPQMQCRT